MPRPDPALLDPARYPFSCAIETRYRDLDTNHHINNGVMASLIEEARVRFHREAGFNRPSAGAGNSVMVASLAIEYLGESHFPEPLDFHVGFIRIGNSSYDLGQLVTQLGKVVIFCRATMVSVSAGVPSAISPDHRKAAHAWMLKP